jgi:hypothetical protein
LKAASNTSSLPAKLPVCDDAAAAACSVFPGLITMMGFVIATSDAADMKDLASLTDGMQEVLFSSYQNTSHARNNIKIMRKRI